MDLVVHSSAFTGGAMPLQDLPQDIQQLRAQHRSLELALGQEISRPLPNAEIITDLKRQKLRIKDAIAELEHTH
jgi:hypothetical protein